MILSVVRHSVLFCKQGEHPPGSPSHLILRTYIREEGQLLYNPRGGLSKDRTCLAPVASLPRSRGRLQLLLDGIGELLGMLRFYMLCRSLVGLSRTWSLLRHLAGDSSKCAGRSRAVAGRSRSILKPSILSFWEMDVSSNNANVLGWRSRIQREVVVLLFDAASRILRRGAVKYHFCVNSSGLGARDTSRVGPGAEPDRWLRQSGGTGNTGKQKPADSLILRLWGAVKARKLSLVFVEILQTFETE